MQPLRGTALRSVTRRLICLLMALSIAACGSPGSSSAKAATGGGSERDCPMGSGFSGRYVGTVSSSPALWNVCIQQGMDLYGSYFTLSGPDQCFTTSGGTIFGFPDFLGTQKKGVRTARLRQLVFTDAAGVEIWPTKSYMTFTETKGNNNMYTWAIRGTGQIKWGDCNGAKVTVDLRLATDHPVPEY